MANDHREDIEKLIEIFESAQKKRKDPDLSAAEKIKAELTDKLGREQLLARMREDHLAPFAVLDFIRQRP